MEKLNSDNSKNPERNPGKIELIASQRFTSEQETYKIVDFLNRNLKKYNLLFGLVKEENDVMIKVYEVE